MTQQPSDWWFPPECEDLHDLPTRAAEVRTGTTGVVKALREPHRRFHARSEYALLLVVQGVDASGKNSLLRHLARGLDPAGFRVWSFGPPAGAELEHDFLWRVGRVLPAFGEIAAFNRSHYEAVLAERLWPVRVPHRMPDWTARHRAINDFERHLTESGTIVLKCWLHLSAAEQKNRLEKRLHDPRKQWKFDEADLRTFRDRDRYLALASETLRVTHTDVAPWHVIPADDRRSARAIVAGILENTLAQRAPEYPGADEALVARMQRMLED